MNNPLVTVGVASYNNGHYVCETLESIRTQTYENLELIIVDDDSTDNSVQIIEQWLSNQPGLNALFIRHDNNRGVCAACNTILNNSKGKYLCIVGSDDVYMPEKITQQVEVFSKLQSDYAVVYSGMYIIDKEGRGIGQNEVDGQVPSYIPAEGNIFELQLMYNRISAPSAMILTQAVRDVGGYDENLSFEDWDIWLRLSKRFKFKFSEFISVKYRVLSSSAWNSRGAKFYESCIKLLIKHLGFNAKNDNIILNHVREYAQLIYKLNGNNSAKWLRFAFIHKPKVKIFLLATLATINIPYIYYEKLVNITK